MSFSIWAVKASVVSILNAKLVPDDVDLVELGRPVAATPLAQPRRVYVGNVVNPDTPVPVWEPGSQLRQENYVVPLFLDVVNECGDLPTGRTDTEALMGALAIAIEAQLRSDPSWGATCQHSGLGLQIEDTVPLPQSANGSGWRSWAVLELHVRRSRI